MGDEVVLKYSCTKALKYIDSVCALNNTNSTTANQSFANINIPIVPPKIILPTGVVRTFPGWDETFPVAGTPPIYRAIIRNSAVLINTTATVRFDKEGNYTCVASSKYGSYRKEFSVIFKGENTPCWLYWVY